MNRFNIEEASSRTVRRMVERGVLRLDELTKTTYVVSKHNAARALRAKARITARVAKRRAH